MQRDLCGTSVIEKLKVASGAENEQVLAGFIESLQTYLRLVADRQLPADLRAKVSPSDIIQNTYIEARRDLKRFVGTTDQDLLAWLCRILVNNAKDAARQYQSRQKRMISREVPLDGVEGTGHYMAPTESPSRIASTSEETVRLQRAIADLPKEYRQVIVLRSLERRSLAEVGEIMGRSEEAVRKLFGRALVQLQKLMSTV
jgi:RNA polymerase sigma-70 factor, ECF subfamily